MTARGQRISRPGLGPTRADVLAHVQQAGRPLPVAEIAAAVGLHPNSARFHLDALVEQGLAIREPEDRDRPGRPRLLFGAPAAPPSPTAAVQDLASALIRHLDRLGPGTVDQAEAAGRAWGDELVASHPGPPLERTLVALAELGYQPVQDSEHPETILLTPCPLGSLINQGVTPDELPTVCRLHLGLIRSLLADDPNYEVRALDAFAAPDRCVVRLNARSEAQPG